MNFSKKLIAAAGVLALSGAVNAADVWQWDLDVVNTASGITSTSEAGATAVLDDLGNLTLTYRFIDNSFAGFETDTVNIDVVSATGGGATGATTFNMTGTSATGLVDSCTGGGCSFVTVGDVFTWDTVEDPINLDFFSGGSFAMSDTFLVGTTNVVSDSTYTLSNGVSAVPVPAAVWFFGSAIAGLAGIARRRNAA